MRHLVLGCIVLVLPLAASIENDQKLGQFTTLAHRVSGEVFRVGDHKLRIENFNYDGQGRYHLLLVIESIKRCNMRF